MTVFIAKDTCTLIAFPILGARVLGGMRQPFVWTGTVMASIGMLLDILSGLIVLSFRRVAESCANATHSTQQSCAVLSDIVFRYVWRVETPFIVGFLSIAVIIFSRAMFGGRFGRAIPWMGAVIGTIGIAGALIGLIQPILLLSIWYIAVGWRLLREAA
ncbi:MAG TPA: hypothetical protein VF018_05400 [Acidobacteriaceae bacterium]